MAVFRVEKNSGYTVMSNHHLRNRNLSLKAKGLLSQMLSLPEDWDYTLQGLARINRESIDAIRQAIRELEQAGYIQRSRERDEKGRLRGADYVIFELPQPVPASVSPTLENPMLENPTQENPTLENPMQLNKDKLITEKQKKEGLNTDSIPIRPMSSLGQLFSQINLKKRKKISPTRLSIGFVNQFEPCGAYLLYIVFVLYCLQRRVIHYSLELLYAHISILGSLLDCNAAFSHLLHKHPEFASFFAFVHHFLNSFAHINHLRALWNIQRCIRNCFNNPRRVCFYQHTRIISQKFR